MHIVTFLASILGGIVSFSLKKKLLRSSCDDKNEDTIFFLLPLAKRYHVFGKTYVNMVNFHGYLSFIGM